MTDSSAVVWRKASRSTANGGNCVEVAWRKASRSTANGDCVEVAGLPGRVLVRDSKDPAGPVLAVPAAAWHAFVRSLGR
jgi:hypothetical protein